MNIAVVDDEGPLRESLLDMLAQWKKTFGEKSACAVSLSCSGFADGETFLESAKHCRYDLVFLDIYMRELSGIDVAARLYQQDRQCVVIFLTSSREHMLDAFSVHAFDYLLKPVEPQRLFAAVEEVAAGMPGWQQALELPIGRGKVPVLYSSIRCIISDAQYCMVYAEDVYRCRSSFGALTKPLAADARFLEINRGILVNMDHVSIMENRTCLLSNGLQLPMNTRSCAKLRQTLTNYRFSCRANRLSGGSIQ